MVRLLPALLAVLLVLPAHGVALPAGGAAVAQDATGVDRSAMPASTSVTQTAPPPNTSNLLLLDSVQASNLTRPTPDLATALSMQGSEMDGRIEAATLESKLASLDDDAEKRRLLLNETATLQREVDAMLAAEEQARAAYLRGDISADEYVRTLARLDAKSDAIERSLGHVSEFYVSKGGATLQLQIGRIRSDMSIVDGAVRSLAAGVIDSGSEPFQLYVGASSNGVVLSTTADDTYVREAYRVDNVARDTSRPGLNGALDRLTQFYPSIRGPDDRNLTGSSPLGLSAWEMGLRHSHGRLTTYFYGNATDPYREIQHKSLPDYPFESSEQTISKNLVLTVSRTYPGGPMAVNLTNTTGTPLDGEVRFNGSTVGTTGDDGMLWALQPDGSFEVSVVHEGERLALDFEPDQAAFAAVGRDDVAGTD